jgi:hypothetical protein
MAIIIKSKYWFVSLEELQKLEVAKLRLIKNLTTP